MANFMVLPPEINSLLMFSGAGSAPMLQAATAWDGLASELSASASSFGSVTSGLAGQAWQGASAQAMTAAAAPYMGWLSQAATQAAAAAGQARAVVSAFEAAQAATVHPILVDLNRNSLVQMVMSNWFGLNAPAIAELESDYEAMWAQDLSAMSGYYSGASAAAAALAPAQTLQQLFATLPNLGIGNIGNANLGNGNTGSGNVGSGNTGSSNLGGGNLGNSNVGSGNRGTNNFGAGNIGAGNIGFGNTGSTITNTGRNVGMGNTGTTTSASEMQEPGTTVAETPATGTSVVGTAASTISASDLPEAMRSVSGTPISTP